MNIFRVKGSYIVRSMVDSVTGCDAGGAERLASVGEDSGSAAVMPSPTVMCVYVKSGASALILADTFAGTVL